MKTIFLQKTDWSVAHLTTNALHHDREVSDKVFPPAFLPVKSCFGNRIGTRRKNLTDFAFSAPQLLFYQHNIKIL